MSKFTELLSSYPAFVGPAIILSSVVIAYVIERIIIASISHLVRKTKTRLDDEIISALKRPIFSTVLLVGAGLALPYAEPSDTTKFFARAILMTLGLLLWTGAGLKIGKSLLDFFSRRVDELKFIQPRTLPLFEIVLKTLVIGGAAYGILVAWKVDVTAWLASAGILGIAIGFAAKDTLANLFSGIFILADAPYKIGDFIVLGSGERGQVTNIGIRSTRILTRDDIEIIVPNASIANDKIINETSGRHPKERVRTTIGVAYGSDIDFVREVLLEVANDCEYLVKDPIPRVRFRKFGESALIFQLLGWIDEPVLRGRAVDELNSNVYKRFQQEKIEIPVNKHDVYIKENPQNTT